MQQQPSPLQQQQMAAMQRQYYAQQYEQYLQAAMRQQQQQQQGGMAPSGVGPKAFPSPQQQQQMYQQQQMAAAAGGAFFGHGGGAAQQPFAAAAAAGPSPSAALNASSASSAAASPAPPKKGKRKVVRRRVASSSADGGAPAPAAAAAALGSSRSSSSVAVGDGGSTPQRPTTTGGGHHRQVTFSPNLERVVTIENTKGLPVPSPREAEAATAAPQPSASISSSISTLFPTTTTTTTSAVAATTTPSSVVGPSSAVKLSSPSVINSSSATITNSPAGNAADKDSNATSTNAAKPSSANAVSIQAQYNQLLAQQQQSMLQKIGGGGAAASTSAQIAASPSSASSSKAKVAVGSGASVVGSPQPPASSSDDGSDASSLQFSRVETPPPSTTALLANKKGGATAATPNPSSSSRHAAGASGRSATAAGNNNNSSNNTINGRSSTKSGASGGHRHPPQQQKTQHQRWRSGSTGSSSGRSAAGVGSSDSTARPRSRSHSYGHGAAVPPRAAVARPSDPSMYPVVVGPYPSTTTRHPTNSSAAGHGGLHTYAVGESPGASFITGVGGRHAEGAVNAEGEEADRWRHQSAILAAAASAARRRGHDGHSGGGDPAHSTSSSDVDAEYAARRAERRAAKEARREERRRRRALLSEADARHAEEKRQRRLLRQQQEEQTERARTHSVGGVATEESKKKKGGAAIPTLDELERLRYSADNAARIREMKRVHGNGALLDDDDYEEGAAAQKKDKKKAEADERRRKAEKDARREADRQQRQRQQERHGGGSGDGNGHCDEGVVGGDGQRGRSPAFAYTPNGWQLPYSTPPLGPHDAHPYGPPRHSLELPPPPTMMMGANPSSYPSSSRHYDQPPHLMARSSPAAGGAEGSRESLFMPTPNHVSLRNGSGHATPNANAIAAQGRSAAPPARMPRSFPSGAEWASDPFGPYGHGSSPHRRGDHHARSHAAGESGSSSPYAGLNADAPPHTNDVFGGLVDSPGGPNGPSSPHSHRRHHHQPMMLSGTNAPPLAELVRFQRFGDPTHRRAGAPTPSQSGSAPPSAAPTTQRPTTSTATATVGGSAALLATAPSPATPLEDPSAGRPNGPYGSRVGTPNRLRSSPVTGHAAAYNSPHQQHRQSPNRSFGRPPFNSSAPSTPSPPSPSDRRGHQTTSPSHQPSHRHSAFAEKGGAVPQLLMRPASPPHQHHVGGVGASGRATPNSVSTNHLQPQASAAAVGGYHHIHSSRATEAWREQRARPGYVDANGNAFVAPNAYGDGEEVASLVVPRLGGGGEGPNGLLAITAGPNGARQQQQQRRVASPAPPSSFASTPMPQRYGDPYIHQQQHPYGSTELDIAESPYYDRSEGGKENASYDRERGSRKASGRGGGKGTGGIASLRGTDIIRGGTSKRTDQYSPASDFSSLSDATTSSYASGAPSPAHSRGTASPFSPHRKGHKAVRAVAAAAEEEEEEGGAALFPSESNAAGAANAAPPVEGLGATDSVAQQMQRKVVVPPPPQPPAAVPLPRRPRRQLPIPFLVQKRARDLLCCWRFGSLLFGIVLFFIAGVALLFIVGGLMDSWVVFASVRSVGILPNQLGLSSFSNIFNNSENADISPLLIDLPPPVSNGVGGSGRHFESSALSSSSSAAPIPPQRWLFPTNLTTATIAASTTAAWAQQGLRIEGLSAGWAKEEEDTYSSSSSSSLSLWPYTSTSVSSSSSALSPSGAVGTSFYNVSAFMGAARLVPDFTVSIGFLSVCNNNGGKGAGGGFDECQMRWRRIRDSFWSVGDEGAEEGRTLSRFEGIVDGMSLGGATASASSSSPASSSSSSTVSSDIVKQSATYAGATANANGFASVLALSLRSRAAAVAKERAAISALLASLAPRIAFYEARVAAEAEGRPYDGNVTNSTVTTAPTTATTGAAGNSTSTTQSATTTAAMTTTAAPATSSPPTEDAFVVPSAAVLARLMALRSSLSDALTSHIPAMADGNDRLKSALRFVGVIAGASLPSAVGFWSQSVWNEIFGDDTSDDGSEAKSVLNFIGPFYNTTAAAASSSSSRGGSVPLPRSLAALLDPLGELAAEAEAIVASSSTSTASRAPLDFTDTLNAATGIRVVRRRIASLGSTAPPTQPTTTRTTTTTQPRPTTTTAATTVRPTTTMATTGAADATTANPTGATPPPPTSTVLASATSTNTATNNSTTTSDSGQSSASSTFPPTANGLRFRSAGNAVSSDGFAVSSRRQMLSFVEEAEGGGEDQQEEAPFGARHEEWQRAFSGAADGSSSGYVDEYTVDPDSASFVFSSYRSLSNGKRCRFGTNQLPYNGLGSQIVRFVFTMANRLAEVRSRSVITTVESGTCSYSSSLSQNASNSSTSVVSLLTTRTETASLFNSLVAASSSWQPSIPSAAAVDGAGEPIDVTDETNGVLGLTPFAAEILNYVGVGCFVGAAFFLLLCVGFLIRLIFIRATMQTMAKRALTYGANPHLYAPLEPEDDADDDEAYDADADHLSGGDGGNGGPSPLSAAALRRARHRAKKRKATKHKLSILYGSSDEARSSPPSPAPAPTIEEATPSSPADNDAANANPNALPKKFAARISDYPDASGRTVEGLRAMGSVMVLSVLLGQGLVIRNEKGNKWKRRMDAHHNRNGRSRRGGGGGGAQGGCCSFCCCCCGQWSALTSRRSPLEDMPKDDNGRPLRPPPPTITVAQFKGMLSSYFFARRGFAVTLGLALVFALFAVVAVGALSYETPLYYCLEGAFDDGYADAEVAAGLWELRDGGSLTDLYSSSGADGSGEQYTAARAEAEVLSISFGRSPASDAAAGSGIAIEGQAGFTAPTPFAPFTFSESETVVSQPPSPPRERRFRYQYHLGPSGTISTDNGAAANAGYVVDGPNAKTNASSNAANNSSSASYPSDFLVLGGGIGTNGATAQMPSTSLYRHTYALLSYARKGLSGLFFANRDRSSVKALTAKADVTRVSGSGGKSSGSSRSFDAASSVFAPASTSFSSSSADSASPLLPSFFSSLSTSVSTTATTTAKPLPSPIAAAATSVDVANKKRAGGHPYAAYQSSLSRLHLAVTYLDTFRVREANPMWLYHSSKAREVVGSAEGALAALAMMEIALGIDSSVGNGGVATTTMPPTTTTSTTSTTATTQRTSTAGTATATVPLATTTRPSTTAVTTSAVTTTAATTAVPSTTAPTIVVPFRSFGAVADGDANTSLSTAEGNSTTMETFAPENQTLTLPTTVAPSSSTVDQHTTVVATSTTTATTTLATSTTTPTPTTTTTTTTTATTRPPRTTVAPTIADASRYYGDFARLVGIAAVSDATVAAVSEWYTNRSNTAVAASTRRGVGEEGEEEAEGKRMLLSGGRRAMRIAAAGGTNSSSTIPPRPTPPAVGFLYDSNMSTAAAAVRASVSSALGLPRLSQLLYSGKAMANLARMARAVSRPAMSSGRENDGASSSSLTAAERAAAEARRTLRGLVLRAGTVTRADVIAEDDRVAFLLAAINIPEAEIADAIQQPKQQVVANNSNSNSSSASNASSSAVACGSSAVAASLRSADASLAAFFTPPRALIPPHLLYWIPLASIPLSTRDIAVGYTRRADASDYGPSGPPAMAPPNGNTLRGTAVVRALLDGWAASRRQAERSVKAQLAAEGTRAPQLQGSLLLSARLLSLNATANGTQSTTNVSSVPPSLVDGGGFAASLSYSSGSSLGSSFSSTTTAAETITVRMVEFSEAVTSAGMATTASLASAGVGASGAGSYSASPPSTSSAKGRAFMMASAEGLADEAAAHSAAPLPPPPALLSETDGHSENGEASEGPLFNGRARALFAAATTLLTQRLSQQPLSASVGQYLPTRSYYTHNLHDAQMGVSAILSYFALVLLVFTIVIFIPIAMIPKRIVEWRRTRRYRSDRWDVALGVVTDDTFRARPTGRGRGSGFHFSSLGRRSPSAGRGRSGQSSAYAGVAAAFSQNGSAAATPQNRSANTSFCAADALAVRAAAEAGFMSNVGASSSPLSGNGSPIAYVGGGFGAGAYQYARHSDASARSTLANPILRDRRRAGGGGGAADGVLSDRDGFINNGGGGATGGGGGRFMFADTLRRAQAVANNPDLCFNVVPFYKTPIGAAQRRGDRDEVRRLLALGGSAAAGTEEAVEEASVGVGRAVVIGADGRSPSAYSNVSGNGKDADAEAEEKRRVAIAAHVAAEAMAAAAASRHRSPRSDDGLATVASTANGSARRGRVADDGTAGVVSPITSAAELSTDSDTSEVDDDERSGAPTPNRKHKKNNKRNSNKSGDGADDVDVVRREAVIGEDGLMYHYEYYYEEVAGEQPEDEEADDEEEMHALVATDDSSPYSPRDGGDGYDTPNRPLRLGPVTSRLHIPALYERSQRYIAKLQRTHRRVLAHYTDWLNSCAGPLLDLTVAETFCRQHILRRYVRAINKWLVYATENNKLTEAHTVALVEEERRLAGLMPRESEGEGEVEGEGRKRSRRGGSSSSSAAALPPSEQNHRSPRSEAASSSAVALPSSGASKRGGGKEAVAVGSSAVVAVSTAEGGNDAQELSISFNGQLTFKQKKRYLRARIADDGALLATLEAEHEETVAALAACDAAIGTIVANASEEEEGVAASASALLGASNVPLLSVATSGAEDKKKDKKHKKSRRESSEAAAANDGDGGFDETASALLEGHRSVSMAPPPAASVSADPQRADVDESAVDTKKEKKSKKDKKSKKEKKKGSATSRNDDDASSEAAVAFPEESVRAGKRRSNSSSNSSEATSTAASSNIVFERLGSETMRPSPAAAAAAAAVASSAAGSSSSKARSSAVTHKKEASDGAEAEREGGVLSPNVRDNTAAAASLSSDVASSTAHRSSASRRNASAASASASGVHQKQTAMNAKRRGDGGSEASVPASPSTAPSASASAPVTAAAAANAVASSSRSRRSRSAASESLTSAAIEPQSNAESVSKRSAISAPVSASASAASPISTLLPLAKAKRSKTRSTTSSDQNQQLITTAVPSVPSATAQTAVVVRLSSAPQLSLHQQRLGLASKAKGLRREMRRVRRRIAKLKRSLERLIYNHKYGEEGEGAEVGDDGFVPSFAIPDTAGVRLLLAHWRSQVVELYNTSAATERGIDGDGSSPPSSWLYSLFGPSEDLLALPDSQISRERLRSGVGGGQGQDDSPSQSPHRETTAATRRVLSDSGSQTIDLYPSAVTVRGEGRRLSEPSPRREDDDSGHHHHHRDRDRDEGSADLLGSVLSALSDGEDDLSSSPAASQRRRHRSRHDTSRSSLARSPSSASASAAATPPPPLYPSPNSPPPPSSSSVPLQSFNNNGNGNSSNNAVAAVATAAAAVGTTVAPQRWSSEWARRYYPLPGEAPASLSGYLLGDPAAATAAAAEEASPRRSPPMVPPASSSALSFVPLQQQHGGGGEEGQQLRVYVGADGRSTSAGAGGSRPPGADYLSATAGLPSSNTNMMYGAGQPFGFSHQKQFPLHNYDGVRMETLPAKYTYSHPPSPSSAFTATVGIGAGGDSDDSDGRRGQPQMIAQKGQSAYNPLSEVGRISNNGGAFPALSEGEAFQYPPSIDASALVATPRASPIRRPATTAVTATATPPTAAVAVAFPTATAFPTSSPSRHRRAAGAVDDGDAAQEAEVDRILAAARAIAAIATEQLEDEADLLRHLPTAAADNVGYGSPSPSSLSTSPARRGGDAYIGGRSLFIGEEVAAPPTVAYEEEVRRHYSSHYEIGGGGGAATGGEDRFLSAVKPLGVVTHSANNANSFGYGHGASSNAYALSGGVATPPSRGQLAAKARALGLGESDGDEDEFIYEDAPPSPLDHGGDGEAAASHIHSNAHDFNNERRHGYANSATHATSLNGYQANNGYTYGASGNGYGEIRGNGYNGGGWPHSVVSTSSPQRWGGDAYATVHSRDMSIGEEGAARCSPNRRAPSPPPASAPHAAPHMYGQRTGYLQVTSSTSTTTTASQRPAVTSMYASAAQQTTAAPHTCSIAIGTTAATAESGTYTYGYAEAVGITKTLDAPPSPQQQQQEVREWHHKKGSHQQRQHFAAPTASSLLAKRDGRPYDPIAASTSAESLRKAREERRGGSTQQLPPLDPRDFLGRSYSADK